ncbi:MAG: hypothetical protein AAF125_08335, partial [Chloroflexota bacterium]
GVAVGALLGARAMLVHAPRVHHLFDLLTIPLLVWSIAGRRGAMPLGTPLNDTFVFFIGFVCTSLLIELLDDTEDPPPYVVPTLTVLSVLGVTFKLSFAAFALVVAGLLLWRNPRQTLAWGVGATALLAGPWLAHGVVTSGYPAFPTVLGAFPVDWIVPCFAANDEATWVYSWARQPFGDPAEVLSGWAWLRPWIVQTFSQDMLIVTPALVTGVGVATALVGCVKVRRWWWAAAPHIATLIFWFFSAPDPRFLGATPWSLAILTIMAASEPLRARSLLALRMGAVVFVVMFSYNFRDELEIVLPWPEGGLYPTPAIAVDAFTVGEGVTIYVPAEGGELCWDGPLPCTPDYRVGATNTIQLAQRDPNELGAGFMAAEEFRDMCEAP